MLTRWPMGSDSLSHGHDASDADERAPAAEAGLTANASPAGSTTANDPAIIPSRAERRLARGLLETLAERNSFIEGLLLAGR